MIDRIGGGFKDYAPFALRVGLATIFITAGAHALVNLSSSPPAWKIVVAVVEILGGLFCLIGFATRWAACGLMILMIWLIAQYAGVHAFTRWEQQLYFACFVMCFALYGLGGGKWSVDEGKKKKE